MVISTRSPGPRPDDRMNDSAHCTSRSNSSHPISNSRRPVAPTGQLAIPKSGARGRVFAASVIDARLMPRLPLAPVLARSSLRSSLALVFGNSCLHHPGEFRHAGGRCQQVVDGAQLHVNVDTESRFEHTGRPAPQFVEVAGSVRWVPGPNPEAIHRIRVTDHLKDPIAQFGYRLEELPDLAHHHRLAADNHFVA